MSTIQLKHTETKHHDALLYNLPEDQIPFTALPSETFERLKLRADGHAKPITILLDEVPIGFFVLDIEDGSQREWFNGMQHLLKKKI